MQGNLRFSGRNKNRLSTYRCNTHRSECRNKEVNKDYLDNYIAELLHEKMFNSKALHKIINRLNTYIRKYNREYDSNYAAVRAEYDEICKSLGNLTEAIEKGIMKLSITLDTLTARILKLSSDSQSGIEPAPFYSWWNTTDCRADSAVAPVAHKISPDHRF